MKKRGLNQLDWAISLAIFILYISWFFLFLKPQIDKTTDLAPLESMIKEKLKEDIYWEVQKYPVFLRSKNILNSTIAFADITPAFGEQNFGLGEQDYFFYKNKVLVLEDFSNDTKYFWVYESNKTYSHNNSRLDIIATNSTATTSKNFKAEFQNGLMRDIVYGNKKLLENTSFWINDNSFQALSEELSDYGILAEYKAESQKADIFSRVIAENSVLWLAVEDKDEDTQERLELSTNVIGFNTFYSDNNNYGNITGNLCKAYQSDFLKLYDNHDFAAFILPEETNISFCRHGSSIELNLTVPIGGDKEFFIILGDDDFVKEDFEGYEALYGLKRTLQGIDLDSLSGLNYSQKKSDWGVPSLRNFHLVIWNASLEDYSNRTRVLLELGEAPLTTSDVYVEEYRDFILGKLGEKQEVTVSIKIW